MMLVSTAHSKVGTTEFSAVIIESKYNGEYSVNEVAIASSWLETRDEAHAWVAEQLRDRRSDDVTEYWAEVSQFEWHEIQLPGVLDADTVEVNRQTGYLTDAGVEWEEPFDPETGLAI